jgi:hypothetical protein
MVSGGTVSFLEVLLFWRSWTIGAILVVLVLMLQGIYHCSGAFSFYIYSSSFFGYVYLYCH